MADDDDQGDESGASFCVYLGMLEPRLERLLWHLEDEPKGEVPHRAGWNATLCK